MGLDRRHVWAYIPTMRVSWFFLVTDYTFILLVFLKAIVENIFLQLVIHGLESRAEQTLNINEPPDKQSECNDYLLRLG